ncbi:APH(3'') family aminoglycoside O-phosphotransferase [Nocardia puris]|uniref:APH(3'') family aminoglycoside O-phosphotransferase n=1 Tax=Nocardia puris TaxID=208602 RepID=UPI0018952B11|nr:APH(3'') family aminoglycoside O-phosphotransferase [Nocardia puris]MBF6367353.1 APH(3'') family aminoglycoside O-phosphotransferase [Nocardia puris]MBF6457538.1 APH(3'') family aminoglycoside O-phosphotransferase [Nocardia puris]
MVEAPERYRSILPTDTAWTPVASGESGAGVFRSADGSRYAKCVVDQDVPELDGERERLVWAAAHDIPCAPVLDWHAGAGIACLVTGTVPGVTAETLSADELGRAWASIADAVRRLHETPTADCPFDRGVARMFALAQDVVARDAVHPEFLPEEQVGTPPAVLLARLAARIDARLAQERANAVVCQGDLCLPNIVVDPATDTVTGFLDLGRLGTADPYADIALLLASSRETWPDEPSAAKADRDFAHRYGLTLDSERLRFYLHLDPLTWG